MGAHALVQIRDAAARANAGAWLRPRTHPGSLSEHNARNAPVRSRQCALGSGGQQGQIDLTACDRCGTRRVGRGRRGRGRARPRDAPRPSRRAQRALPEAGSVPWQRRTAGPARSHRLRSARNATRRPDDAGRCGAVWDCRNRRSRVVEALRQRRARAAQAARVHCAAAPPTAMWHEPAGKDE